MTTQKKNQFCLTAIFAACAFLAAGCSNMMGSGGSKPATASTSAPALSGAQEVPANNSTASGKSTIQIASDKSVSGTVTVTGMTPTASHIHEAAKGTNGPVIVPLTKTSDTTFSAPSNAKLTDAQYASYKAGNLYVNVHSATYPGGEIRIQLVP